jgi:hypothetical protein
MSYSNSRMVILPAGDATTEAVARSHTHSSLYTIWYTLYTIHYTLYTIHYTQTIHCLLHTIHYTNTINTILIHYILPAGDAMTLAVARSHTNNSLPTPDVVRVNPLVLISIPLTPSVCCPVRESSRVKLLRVTCITIIDTIIQTNYTKDAYIYYDIWHLPVKDNKRVKLLRAS